MTSSPSESPIIPVSSWVPAAGLEPAPSNLSEPVSGVPSDSHLTKPTAYMQARADIEKEIATLERMVPATQLADEIEELFPAVFGKCAVVSTGSTTISIRIDDLKQMVPVARAVALRGFHIKRVMDQASDNVRRYFYEDSGGLSFGKLSASAGRSDAEIGGQP